MPSSSTSRASARERIKRKHVRKLPAAVASRGSRKGRDAREPGQVLVAHGPLAAEQMLLARIEALVAEARKDPSLLARPVRIVVPSRSLRAHVGAAIVRSRGRSVAGVTIQTLFGLACEVLERGGEPAPRGMPLFDVLAQRLARAEPALRKGLEGLVDGYAAVVGILGAVNIPIVHFSVKWWRALHQPSTILGPGPSPIDPAIGLALLVNWIAFTLLFAYFLARRIEIARLEET